MEIEKKKVIGSNLFEEFDIPSIYEYGEVTFGLRLADMFYFEIIENVRLLEIQYLIHPECRHLETKSKKYRNIILGSYLIIYRITSTRVEVLRAFHGSRSPRTIQKSRSIKII